MSKGALGSNIPHCTSHGAIDARTVPGDVAINAAAIGIDSPVSRDATKRRESRFMCPPTPDRPRTSHRDGPGRNIGQMCVQASWVPTFSQRRPGHGGFAPIEDVNRHPVDICITWIEVALVDAGGIPDVHVPYPLHVGGAREHKAIVDVPI